MTEVKISCYFNYTACIFNSLKLIDGSKIPSLQTAVFVKVRRLISFSVATLQDSTAADEPARRVLSCLSRAATQ